MNATQFQNIIDRKDFLEEFEILQIQKMQEKYPFFQIPHFLIARHEFLSNPSITPPNLGYAAINSPNRIYLKAAMEAQKNQDHLIHAGDFHADTPIEIEITEQGTKSSIQKISEKIREAKTEQTNPKPARRKIPADDIIESIRKKEKKVIQDSKMKEQIDLIKAFSKKEIKLATIKEIEDNQNPENLAQSSTVFHDNLLSESYAKLLVLQGKKKPAREIYRKLILKFPDKRTYFEELIEKLKD